MQTKDFSLNVRQTPKHLPVQPNAEIRNHDRDQLPRERLRSTGKEMWRGLVWLRKPATMIGVQNPE